MRETDSEAKILLTTGYGSNEEIQQLMDLGVDGVLPKPYSIEALMQGVEKMVEVPV